MKCRRFRMVIAFAAMGFAAAGSLAQVKGEPGKSKKKPKAKTVTKMVTASDASGKVECYLARPKSDESAPAIILIHEWWGLNDWIKKQADRFAERGYVALAPDLYHGEVASDRDHAHELMRGLPEDRAVADLKRAFAFFSKQSYTKGKPIGVIGWCMGGGYALKLAIAEPRLKCTVICYGQPVTDVNALKKITGPLLGIWGATDRGIAVEPFKKALTEAGVQATHHIYPGAGHAFLNETNKRGYNKAQAETAWKEIDGFLRNQLLERRSMGNQSKEQHAVLIFVDFSKSPGDKIGKYSDVMGFEDDLIAAIERAKVGEFDGNEIGQETLTLYMYGPSADQLFEAIRGVLKAADLPQGTYALKRYGEPGASETRIEVTEF